MAGLHAECTGWSLGSDVTRRGRLLPVDPPLLRGLRAARLAAPAGPAVAASPARCAVGHDVEMSAVRAQAHAIGEGTELSRCDDHQVIALLESRPAPAAGPTPKLYRVAIRPPAAAPAPAPAPAPSSASRRPAPAPPPPAVADVAALRPDLDAAAMAQTLRDAARDGVPFCVECARTAARAAA